jgi:uncharacterized protein (TIGR00299 family) protein
VSTGGRGTTAWFHCFAGIAGDMALGSLIDAGADPDEVRSMLKRIPVGGWSLEVEPVLRGGISATRALTRVETDTVVRTHAHIVGLIEEARLPDRARRRALGAFGALASAEGRLHGRHPSQVHFHEVGGHDAIVEIVGTCAALEALDVDRVESSPVTTGTGIVRTAHGVLPNPAPAVVEILKDAPLQGRNVNVELTTPTGAALLAGTVSQYGPLPPMTIVATGFGAGSRDIEDLPNVTQVVLGEPKAEEPDAGHELLQLETNVDDATGETLAHAISQLLDAGAHDAWVTPVYMKKGRPGHVVSVIADPALADSLGEILRAETGSLGVRAHGIRRRPAARSVAEVEVEGYPLRVKVSSGRVKVEHDDAVRAARRTGLPLREVVWRAESSWRVERERVDDSDRAGDGLDDGPAS